MGIEIILYDSSPVVQKIFLHVLYHYNPTIHRIDQTSNLLEKIQYSKPDIIFIDASFSQDIKNQVDKTQLNNIPVILMAKTELNPEEWPSHLAIEFLKKPISADKLRNLVTRFVPKAKKNILTTHLKFPPIPDFVENEEEHEAINLQHITSQEKNHTPLLEEEINLQHIAPTPPPGTDQNTQQPSKEGIKPITGTSWTKAQDKIQEDAQESKPIQPPTFQQPPRSPSKKEEGIKPITGTRFTEIQSAIQEDAQESKPIQPPTFQQQPRSPSKKEEGIKPITGTRFTEIQSAIQEDAQESKPIQPPTFQQPPRSPSKKEEGIKPITGTRFTEIQSAIQEDAQESKPIQPPTFQQQPRSPSKKEEGIKPITHKIANFKPIPKPESGQEDIKQWIKKQTQEEVSKQLQSLFEQSGKVVIQKIAEKMVSKAVPELARELITKELNQLLLNEEQQEPGAKAPPSTVSPITPHHHPASAGPFTPSVAKENSSPATIENSEEEELNSMDLDDIDDDIGHLNNLTNLHDLDDDRNENLDDHYNNDE